MHGGDAHGRRRDRDEYATMPVGAEGDEGVDVQAKEPCMGSGGLAREPRIMGSDGTWKLNRGIMIFYRKNKQKENRKNKKYISC